MADRLVQCASLESPSQQPSRQVPRPARTTRVTPLTRSARTWVWLRVSRFVSFSPHLLCNSPRLNDLAIRSNEYLASKIFLLTTFRFRATIPHGIGAPATECRAAFLINSLPALFSELCVDSAPSASLYPEPRRERYPLPEKHQNSDVNYL